MNAERPQHFYYEEQPLDIARVSSNIPRVTNTEMKKGEQVSSTRTERVIEFSKNGDAELFVALYGKEHQMIVKELTKSLGHRSSSVIAKNWTAIRKVIDKNKKKFM